MQLFNANKIIPFIHVLVFCIFFTVGFRKVDIQKIELEVMILKECDCLSMVDVASCLPGQLLELVGSVITYHTRHILQWLT
jgi:hypothetical protein